MTEFLWVVGHRGGGVPDCHGVSIIEKDVRLHGTLFGHLPDGKSVGEGREGSQNLTGVGPQRVFTGARGA